MSLRREDFHSDAWKRVKDALIVRLAELRASNDADHDQTKTAAIRGRILEVKRMLSLEPSESDEADPDA